MNEFHEYDMNEWAGRYGSAEHGLFAVSVALKLPQPGVWIAGGAVRDFARNEPIDSDVDVFFTGQQTFDAFTAAMETRPDAKRITVADGYITYSLNVDGKSVKVQAIRFGFYECMAECLDSFDFTACQFATDGVVMKCGQFALFDLARKRLAVHKVTYGASLVRRMLKYARRGFTACQGCIVALLEGMGADPNIVHADIKYVD